MTDPRIIAERTAGDWVLATDVAAVTPNHPSKPETRAPAQLLRDSGLAHYGCGVSVRRVGLGFQIFGGDASRLLATCTTLDAADFVARALAGLTFRVLETLPAWKCPKCSEVVTKVVDSRPRPSDILRRRECLSCGARWSTSERIVVVR